MTENVKTYLRVGGQDYEASAVDHPSDKAFRGAWEHDGEAIVVNMVKAREIHRDKLRQERQERFPPLDNVVRRLSRKKDISGQLTAEEIEQYAAAEAAAQTLRNVPEDPRIDAAETPEALSALTLDALIA